MAVSAARCGEKLQLPLFFNNLRKRNKKKRSITNVEEEQRFREEFEVKTIKTEKENCLKKGISSSLL